MRDFKFNYTDKEEDTEAILNYRKRKINKQQLIFIFILILILFIVGIYVCRKVFYTDFDGFIKVDVNAHRTDDDIFLKKMYVLPGDFIVPGDTLYSYMYLNNLLENLNSNEEPDVLKQNRDIKIRYFTVLHDFDVLKVKIKEMERQIDIEDHNINFGLSNNTHKLELERELKEAKAKYKGMRQELDLLRSMVRELNAVLKHSTYNPNKPITVNDIASCSSEVKFSQIYYRLAQDTAIVADVKFPNNTIAFKKEEILTLQSINSTANNLRIIAYVPSDKIKKLNNFTKADVIINDNISFTAHTAILGLHAIEIPSNLRSNFSRQAIVPSVTFLPDSDQIIPFWTLSANLPVTIRIQNIKFERKKGDYILFRTGKGLEEDSKKYLIEHRQLGCLE